MTTRTKDREKQKEQNQISWSLTKQEKIVIRKKRRDRIKKKREGIKTKNKANIGTIMREIVNMRDLMKKIKPLMYPKD